MNLIILVICSVPVIVLAVLLVYRYEVVHPETAEEAADRQINSM